MEFYKLPVGRLGESMVAFATGPLKPAFGVLAVVVLTLSHAFRTVLLGTPPWILFAGVLILCWWAAGRRLAIFALVSLCMLLNLGLWEATLVTVSLVATATLLSLLVAIPLGVLMAEERTVAAVMVPILDFLQTIPRFVLLVPAVVIFGIDTVGGVVATMTLAIPSPVRLTALGIRQTDREVIEAGEAFGCSRWQLLCKIKLPSAFPSILLGVNQCIMMSLSIVVIAAMIGAGGLGENILTGIVRLDVGQGFEAGLGVVVVAILIDRITKGFIGRQLGERGSHGIEK